MRGAGRVWHNALEPALGAGDSSMSGIADWAEDALFDGALLFDDGGTGSRESIA